MSSNYLSDAENFFTHDEVSPRESMAGTSILIGILLVALAVGLAMWWRRRAG